SRRKLWTKRSGRRWRRSRSRSYRSLAAGCGGRLLGFTKYQKAGCTYLQEREAAMGLKWDQTEEIAEVLAENHPGLDPLDARFTDLRQWVIDLDEFDDDPNESNEAKLEAIQMAWH